MRVQVTGHHVDITPGLRSFVEGKLEKLEEFYPKLRAVSVVVTVEKYRHTAEIHFHADGVEMSAKKTTKDMYASIEEAVSALQQQAAKRKDRLHTSAALRRTAAHEAKTRSRATAKKGAAEEAAVPKPKVVRVRGNSAKSITLDEAIEALEESGKQHLLFRDAASGAVQLLFRREDGHYGLAEA
jgi:putative sigma-54 modulation protein